MLITPLTLYAVAVKRVLSLGEELLIQATERCVTESAGDSI